jgi:hypothetical protein
VDSIPVVKLPSGDLITFEFLRRFASAPEQAQGKTEGDAPTAQDFSAWVVSRTRRFD